MSRLRRNIRHGCRLRLADGDDIGRQRGHEVCHEIPLGPTPNSLSVASESDFVSTWMAVMLALWHEFVVKIGDLGCDLGLCDPRLPPGDLRCNRPCEDGGQTFSKSEMRHTAQNRVRAQVPCGLGQSSQEAECADDLRPRPLVSEECSSRRRFLPAFCTGAKKVTWISESDESSCSLHHENGSAPKRCNDACADDKNGRASTPVTLNLAELIPELTRFERTVHFGINAEMLEHIAKHFRLDSSCRHIPATCKLHPAARELLANTRTPLAGETVQCLKLFVDGSFDPTSRVCAWSAAAFDSRGQEDVWLGCMAGCVPDFCLTGQTSAFQAELFAQFIAALIGVGCDCECVHVLYDARSASGIAVGDCQDVSQLAIVEPLISAWTLVRSQGKCVLQEHVKSHSGCPGNELADSLASFAAETRCGLHAPPDSLIHDMLAEKVLDWMWMFAEGDANWQLPKVGVDGDALGEPICAGRYAPKQSPLEMRNFGEPIATTQSQHALVLDLRVISYNTLSLASKGQNAALSSEMRRLKAHVIGLQECRETVDSIRFQDDICKIAGPVVEGRLGCQAWIDCSRPIAWHADGAAICWDRSAFRVLHADERILVVGAQALGQRFAVVVAHACTSVAPRAERDAFWDRLSVVVGAVPRGYIPLWCIDANARFELGTQEPAHHCSNAERFSDILARFDLGFSGNVHRSGQPIVSWIHPGNGCQTSCLDYLAFPSVWGPGTRVVEELDLLDVHAGHNHFPVAVDICAVLTFGKGARSAVIDVELLSAPEGRDKAEQIITNAPQIPWHVDVNQHLECLNEYLFNSFARAFPRSRRPRNPVLSDASWALISEKRQARRLIIRIKSLHSRSVLDWVFQAWKRGRITRRMQHRHRSRLVRLSLQQACAVNTLRALGISLRRAVKEDEAVFTRNMFEQARREGSAALAGLLRAVLRTGRRYKAHRLSPCLRIGNRVVDDPQEVRHELGRHFARAEHAREVPFGEVQVDDKHDAASGRGSIAVEGMPAVAQTALAFASMKKRRAPGLSGLPADVFQCCPVASARLHAPVFLKMLSRDQAPVIWSGSLIAPVPKPGKPLCELQGFRSVALQEAPMKAFAKAIRQDVINAVEKAAPDGLSGGRRGHPTATTSIAVQAHLAKLQRCHLSGGILFLDGVSAFYSVNRQLLFPAQDSGELHSWVDSLQVDAGLKAQMRHCCMDPRFWNGLKLLSRSGRCLLLPLPGRGLLVCLKRKKYFEQQRGPYQGPRWLTRCFRLL